MRRCLGRFICLGGMMMVWLLRRRRNRRRCWRGRLVGRRQETSRRLFLGRQQQQSISLLLTSGRLRGRLDNKLVKILAQLLFVFGNTRCSWHGAFCWLSVSCGLTRESLLHSRIFSTLPSQRTHPQQIAKLRCTEKGPHPKPDQAHRETLLLLYGRLSLNKKEMECSLQST